MKLAKLPDSEAPKLERLAFARKALLGKTLDLVHQMEVRPLANVLWAVGKLRLDLARQVPLGPRLGQQLEGRIRQLVAGGALQDHHAVQLWYGMYFSRYRWSWELLHTLVAAQLPLMDTMNIKGLSTVSGSRGLVCRVVTIKVSGSSYPLVVLRPLTSSTPVLCLHNYKEGLFSTENCSA